MEVMKTVVLNIMLVIAVVCKAQFPGPVGTPATTAMHKDSSAFVNWAKTCMVTRGYQDMANTGLGYATLGADTNGTGKAGNNPVVSLGDGGTAVLTFQPPINNGPGPDFAVFENAFDNAFLELAFVEVSSDGINYVRFPSVSNTSTVTQIGPFDALGDATKLYNLAGKYKVEYGTPFDLQELSTSQGLNIGAVTHVKIIDVVGAIQAPFATYDKNNHPVNDPYPTAFGSGGFDLDAIGVIHQNVVSVSEHNLENSLYLYPNPATDVVSLISVQANNISKVEVSDAQGRMVYQGADQTIRIKEWTNGLYFFKITSAEGRVIIKKIVKH